MTKRQIYRQLRSRTLASVSVVALSMFVAAQAQPVWQSYAISMPVADIDPLLRDPSKFKDDEASRTGRGYKVKTKRAIPPAASAAATRPKQKPTALPSAPARLGSGFAALLDHTIDEGDWTSRITGELRVFANKPDYAGVDDTVLSPSMSIEYRASTSTPSGRDEFVLVPFARIDGTDQNRSHVDLREAYWLHKAENWDLVFGLNRVFWGVTESRHLVDIINQTDLVEDIDGEDKLGQPMFNLNFSTNNATLRTYVMSGFRTRTFPDSDARLRGPLPIASDRSPLKSGGAQFESPAAEAHVDLAARYERTFGAFDVGLSVFDGTSREPRLVPTATPSGLVLVPHYDQIEQAGLDAQATFGNWAAKVEAISRNTPTGKFAAAVGGFEYTLWDAFDGWGDIGLLAEYNYDERDAGTLSATSTFGSLADNDLFLGLRLSPAGAYNSRFLAGTLVDLETGATVVNLEMGRRLTDSIDIELDARLFPNAPSDDPLSLFDKESFIQVRLTRYGRK